MKPTTLTHQQSNESSAASHVGNAATLTSVNPAVPLVPNPTVPLVPNPAASHVPNSTARLNASVVTLLNADPTSPSKETAKEENR